MPALSLLSRLLFVCLVLLPGFTPLGAYELKSQYFAPDKYYIGQRVRMVLEIEVQPSEMQLRAGELDSNNTSVKLPNNLNYQIYKVNVFPASAPNTYTIELNYAVFTTDVGRLGPFEVQGFAIAALTIPRALSSLADKDTSRVKQELPSLESVPLSLPWVDLSIAVLIQVLVLLPILAFQSSRRLRKWFYIMHQNFLQRKPYHQFLRQLHMLQQAENLSAQEYYRILSSQMRYYLELRTAYPCSAYTTEELAQLNPLPLLEPQELWQQVLAVLQASDDLRFRTPVHIQMPEGQQLARAGLIDNKQKQKEVTTILHFAKLVEKQFRQQELRHV